MFLFKKRQHKFLLFSGSKAFSLVELLIVIAIIGFLVTIIMVSTKGTIEDANEAKEEQNRSRANLYCLTNPGVSTLDGDVVYCDEKHVMWSATLASGYIWGPTTVLPVYANGNCNNLTEADMINYPACNACANLDYAGFTGGWQLPSQGVPSEGAYCDTSCGRDGNYCASDRQLWDFGDENCDNWGPTICTSSPGACSPTWDPSAASSPYWSSTQGESETKAWSLNFYNAYSWTDTKSVSKLVRCFLGKI
jgi:prepilin-type N-terminal cleavage/methylation domain-containing protein